MIEAELALFEVQLGSVSGHAVEPTKAVLDVVPKALDVVNVAAAVDELIVVVIDSQVLGISVRLPGMWCIAGMFPPNDADAMEGDRLRSTAVGSVCDNRCGLVIRLAASRRTHV